MQRVSAQADRGGEAQLEEAEAVITNTALTGNISGTGVPPHTGYWWLKTSKYAFVSLVEVWCPGDGSHDMLYRDILDPHWGSKKKQPHLKKIGPRAMYYGPVKFLYPSADNFSKP